MTRHFGVPQRIDRPRMISRFGWIVIVFFTLCLVAGAILGVVIDA